MRESYHGGGRTMDDPDGRPSKIPHLFHNGSVATTASEDVSRHSSASSASPVGYYSDRSNSHNGATSPDSSPYTMSPWNQTSSWSAADPNEANPFAPDHLNSDSLFPPGTGLVGSLVREEGHIYSLAANGGLLYTGSDSKNIRVWKDQQEYCGFKANSGLVKAIIISSDRIFTGHQDGKIRIWKKSPKNPKIHKRVGTLPRLKDFIKSSMKPSNYVSHGHGHKSAVWIRHSDAVSCLAISEDATILYSGSWDRTIKVWRLSDSRCLESVSAHDDAVNSVIVAVDGLVFSGSADGTVKVWKRETSGKGTRHSAVQTLLKQECAVTALAVSVTARMVYCGSSDGVINFWEMDRQLVHGGVLNGHKMAVLCLAAAGNLLFTGSADKTICVWRREGDGGHVCMSVMTGHGGPVKCLAVESDITATGNMWVVYSGSLDKSVKVWKVAESEGGGEGAEPRFDMY